MILFFSCLKAYSFQKVKGEHWLMFHSNFIISQYIFWTTSPSSRVSKMLDNWLFCTLHRLVAHNIYIDIIFSVILLIILPQNVINMFHQVNSFYSFIKNFFFLICLLWYFIFLLLVKSTILLTLQCFMLTIMIFRWK